MWFKPKNIFFIFLFILLIPPTFAAKMIILRHQSLSLLHRFLLEPGLSSSGFPLLRLQEISRHMDFHHTLHVRIRETYANYPVWGSDAVLHVPQANAVLQNKSLFRLASSALPTSSMNGIFYQDLEKDVQNLSAPILTARIDQAVTQAMLIYQKKNNGFHSLSNRMAAVIVYIDKNKKAHWAYYIQFQDHPVHGIPIQPIYILDALTFQVYQTWNNIKTYRYPMLSIGGGYGGNEKMGKLTYDGLTSHYPAFTIQRDTTQQICYLENNEIVVKNAKNNGAIESYICSQQDSKHNNLFWDGSLDAANGAYSPGNDALFSGSIIKSLYQKWYGVPVLTRQNKPMKLVMRVHEDMENAYWDGEQMAFGDGVPLFYPLVSLGISAHEISHGFTDQHANLVYDGQSGGLNESFSDMAAKAAEFYVNKQHSWSIGDEVTKSEEEVFRYMDHPSRDCEWKTQGDCSIEQVENYHEGLDVHYSSGIFNRVFYLIATTPGWDTKKAFDVMVQANMHYWTPTVTFTEAACGVMESVRDYGYADTAVIRAFSEVGINAQEC